MNKIIDGKGVAEKISRCLTAEASSLNRAGITPKLTVILVGKDPASRVYVRNKEKAAKEIGILGILEKYDNDVTEKIVLNRIIELNSDETNHGILIQLPLPSHIDENRVLLSINPDKDVDGFHPVNMGKLLSGQKCLKPCTPSGIIELIESTGEKIEGKNALVVGRSNIVGKPVSIMLLEKNATVTIAHSKTKDLPEKVGKADILVAAIGRPEFIKGGWIKDGATVIDVGINRTEDRRLVGDVEFAEALKRAAHITPVPGGVGPMTIAMLMKNTLSAARQCLDKENGC